MFRPDIIVSFDPRKLMDVERLNAMGWKAQTDMRDGLARAYRDLLSAYQVAR